MGEKKHRICRANCSRARGILFVARSIHDRGILFARIVLDKDQSTHECKPPQSRHRKRTENRPPIVSRFCYRRRVQRRFVLFLFPDFCVTMLRQSSTINPLVWFGTIIVEELFTADEELKRNARPRKTLARFSPVRSNLL